MLNALLKKLSNNLTKTYLTIQAATLVAHFAGESPLGRDRPVKSLARLVLDLQRPGAAHAWHWRFFRAAPRLLRATAGAGRGIGDRLCGCRCFPGSR